jgi:hypothetical protein
MKRTVHLSNDFISLWVDRQGECIYGSPVIRGLDVRAHPTIAGDSNWVEDAVGIHEVWELA